MGDFGLLVPLTLAVVEASRVRPGDSVAGCGPNSTGGTLIRPGGRDAYAAFWIRDFAISLESGVIALEELEHALRLTARLQASNHWETPTGSIIPRGSIADHITLDGTPVFFPGTNSLETQGQPWGYYPSLDDNFYFVEMAWQLVRIPGRSEMLDEKIDGVSLLERLDLAFHATPTREDSGLVWCDEEKRGVSFGFTDVVVQTGDLLFCSILRYRAASQLADLQEMVGNTEIANRYRSIAKRISRNVPRVFAHESGLLRAATGKSGQPDVWGSAFAVYSGLLGKQKSAEVSSALHKALAAGTISWRGNIRHLPTNLDFNEHTAWEKTVNDYPKNRYQNGAYWSTPTGWVCFAVAQVDESAARHLAMEYLQDLRNGDFRQGNRFGSPYECIHPDGDYRNNPVYMTSVTCPLGAFRRLGWITN
ncbi:MAG: hypothetical protein WBG01_18145 [Bacteroidota bacterium]